jgi:hypothetical protein
MNSMTIFAASRTLDGTHWTSFGDGIIADLCGFQAIANVGHVDIDIFMKFASKFVHDEIRNGGTLLDETIQVGAAVLDKINAVHALIAALGQFDADCSVKFTPRECTSSVGFHDLSDLEKFRERCKESGSNAERADADLQNSLILNRETGHPKICSPRDGTNEDDGKSQTLVPLAVVMHAMCM